jgi:hypothetical protein
LLDFYKSIPVEVDGAEAAGLPKLVTEAARKFSPSLGDGSLQPVGQEETDKWLKYWKLTA